MKTQTASKTAEASKKSGTTSEKDVKIIQAGDVKKDEKDEKEKTPEKVKPVTKKSVIIEMISRPEGALVSEMAQVIVDKGIDPDLQKNTRVVRLWLSKLGIPVRKSDDGHYMKA